MQVNTPQQKIIFSIYYGVRLICVGLDTIQGSGTVPPSATEAPTHSRTGHGGAPFQPTGRSRSLLCGCLYTCTVSWVGQEGRTQNVSSFVRINVLSQSSTHNRVLSPLTFYSGGSRSTVVTCRNMKDQVVFRTQFRVGVRKVICCLREQYLFYRDIGTCYSYPCGDWGMRGPM
ncbi:hypothetical protein BHM03_00044551 [Ensete ventricosum]|nr:hypothetical protein BHM03_00044551 [Ensete ventricosum]